MARLCLQQSYIQETLPQATWKFVPGIENPADCATRGLTPTQLSEHSIWWTGPQDSGSHNLRKPGRNRRYHHRTRITSRSDPPKFALILKPKLKNFGILSINTQVLHDCCALLVGVLEQFDDLANNPILQ